jgi:hypothetical protein
LPQNNYCTVLVNVFSVNFRIKPIDQVGVIMLNVINKLKTLENPGSVGVKLRKAFIPENQGIVSGGNPRVVLASLHFFC